MPAYESGGQEFESLRARHLVPVCEHWDGALWLARIALKEVVAALRPDLAVINLKSGDGCKQAFRKGAEPAVKFSFTMRLKRSINGGSIRI
jgi:hypothetical protein